MNESSVFLYYFEVYDNIIEIDVIKYVQKES